MKVYIHGQGDTSVGIPNPSAVLDLEDCDLAAEVDRIWLRGQVCLLFGTLWDTKAGARFEDECPDCGKLMVHRAKPLSLKSCRIVYVCDNPQCIRNQPEPEQEKE